MSTLTIDLNQEYKIKIEKGNEFYKSIFKEVYIDASKNVVEIIKQSEKGITYDDYNNIIAFTGERGKGKSSSMISFNDALVNKNDENHKDFFDGRNLGKNLLSESFENIRKNKFASIDIIDPSLFRGNESLFEIILAKMFFKFQDNIKKTDSKVTDEIRRTLIKHFQSVFENLQIINSDRKDLYKLETIEALSKLATSSNLRDSFKRLVDYYLEFFEKKDLLIIAIDDFDLNINGIYQMLEDIRQFLIQRNIIILTAFKKEQIIQSLKNSMFEKEKNLSEEEVRNRASKYFEKLFPHKHLVYLPNINEIGNNDISDIDEKNEITIKSENFDETFKLKTKENLVDIVKMFLNKRLDLFLLNYSFKQNFLIPTTLRETIELLNTANYLKFDKIDQLLVFEKYLIEKIINSLRPDYVDFFMSFKDINKNLIKIGIFKKLYELLENEDKELFKELYVINNPNNISLGDVLSIIEKYGEKTSVLDKDRLIFIDYLLAYFSIECLIIEQDLSTKFIYNGIIQKFRKENNKYRRDFFEFNYGLNQLFDKKRNDKTIFLHSFINSYGKTDNTINKQKSSTLFFKLDSGFSHGTFTPFAIFTNFKYLKANLSDKIFNDVSEEFKNDILKYDDIFIEYVLNDPLFAYEFVNTVSEYSYEYKDKIEDEFLGAYEFIYVGGRKALEKLISINDNSKDQLIKSFDDFPIFKIWKNEIENKNSEIRKEYLKIYNSSKSEIYLTQQMISDIRYYISELSNKSFTKAKITNFHKKIKSENEKSLLLKEIITFSNSYFKRNVEEEEKKYLLKSFIDYLNEIIDGQSS
ncbi:hypothetical protein BD847_0266 [Flavobacterium cutihirudinis]|uniref:Uncharacterized protein n=1 Tax=Flavobacterium cutihirudinis TaxID=1265740 RepID=A0A3D9FZE5_9FLAO|nr:hypothetical protein [Flavobacterium cutihirudinis]RED26348.1 hypothetical protein BD847_0266 [Flavobacterium cutihirudinis]